MSVVLRGDGQDLDSTKPALDVPSPPESSMFWHPNFGGVNVSFVLVRGTRLAGCFLAGMLDLFSASRTAAPVLGLALLLPIGAPVSASFSWCEKIVLN